MHHRRLFPCLLTSTLVLAACVKRQNVENAAPVAGGPLSAASAEQPKAPPPPLQAPQPPKLDTGSVSLDRFLTLWTDIHQLKNGYFSKEGIPYHAVETLLVEAPDHGHETTSETYSYWVWLEAYYGKITGDYSFLKRSYDNLEYYLVPAQADQPTSTAYQANKPSTYAPEADTLEEYPVALNSSVGIGHDPIGDELKATYGTADIYSMHWLMDVDNWYGFGRRGDGTSSAALINTFQRGPQESVWEAVTQPAWDNFKWGSKNGFLDLFLASKNQAKQWKYSNAPDADARAVQAIYWAKRWADEAGGKPEVNELAEKAAKLGDYGRYSLFDKYFKPIGCASLSCEPAKDYESAHHLVSWYFAWGGSLPGTSAWAWRIGSSHVHSGYQNPLAAYALSQDPSLKPKSPGGARDWAQSLSRQLELYRWLQAAEGGIAGGVTNSSKGRYETVSAGVPRFYGMSYEASPVFQDPPSNDWFGFQVWSMERVAEYYYVTGDPRALSILKPWVKWVLDNTELGHGDDYAIPSSLAWSGEPSASYAGPDNSLFAAKGAHNRTLHVKVVSKTEDVGTTAGLVQTLSFFAKRAKDPEAQRVAHELLERMWKKHKDALGISNPETRKDYSRFGQKLTLPEGFAGSMPNGDQLKPGASFVDIRSRFRQDPAWPKVQAYLDGGAAPEFKYHRFWAQAHVALAYGTYGWLFEQK